MSKLFEVVRTDDTAHTLHADHVSSIRELGNLTVVHMVDGSKFSISASYADVVHLWKQALDDAAVTDVAPDSADKLTKPIGVKPEELAGMSVVCGCTACMVAKSIP